MNPGVLPILLLRLNYTPRGVTKATNNTYVATERASNPTEDGPDNEGSEITADSSKFNSRACGQGRSKRQKK